MQCPLQAEQARTVSPLFLQENHEDMTYASMRRSLQSALRLPSENRWVADWLFLDSDRNFHKNIRLSPDAFSTAHAMNIRHDFFPESRPPTRCTNQALNERTNEAVTKDVDLLLVPAANKNSLSVGYCFMEGKMGSPDENCSTSYVGRFVYACRTTDLLMVMSFPPNSPDNVTALMTVNWSQELQRREHTFVICPKGDYNFRNLPSTVLSVCTAFSMTNERTAPPPDFSDCMMEPVSDHVAEQLLFDLFRDQQQTADPSNSGMLDAIIDGLPAVDTSTSTSTTTTQLAYPIHESPCSRQKGITDTAWMSSGNGSPKDVVDYPEEVDVSFLSGAYDMSSLTDSLLGIESSLMGDFFGSRINQPFVNQRCGKDPPAFATVMTKIDPATMNMTQKLQQMAAVKYYTATMSVLLDRQLLPPAGSSGGSDTDPNSELVSRSNAVSTGIEVGNGTYEGDSLPIATKLAPRPLDETVKEGVDGDDAARLEAKREEKRRKNRMSAARSNEKRKKKWDMQKRTLADLQSEVRRLTERKQVLVGENKRLKGQMMSN